IGCGWLGLPLAKTLLKSSFLVKGSTTNPEKIEVLEQSGIVPFLIQLESEKPIGKIKDFLNVDLLIINVPPGRASNDADSYVDRLLGLKNEVLLSSVRKIIFISSTSVYAENNGVQSETSDNFGGENTSLRM